MANRALEGLSPTEYDGTNANADARVLRPKTRLLHVLVHVAPRTIDRKQSILVTDTCSRMDEKEQVPPVGILVHVLKLLVTKARILFIATTKQPQCKNS